MDSGCHYSLLQKPARGCLLKKTVEFPHREGHVLVCETNPIAGYRRAVDCITSFTLPLTITKRGHLPQMMMLMTAVPLYEHVRVVIFMSCVYTIYTAI